MESILVMRKVIPCSYVQLCTLNRVLLASPALARLVFRHLADELLHVWFRHKVRVTSAETTTQHGLLWLWFVMNGSFTLLWTWSIVNVICYELDGYVHGLFQVLCNDSILWRWSALNRHCWSYHILVNKGWCDFLCEQRRLKIFMCFW